MPSPPTDEHGIAALIELLRRNAEAMEASKASHDAVRAELGRSADELRRVGERVADLEDTLSDIVAVEQTRVEQRKQSWELFRTMAKSPIVHAAAVAILGAVLNLLGLSWVMGGGLLPGPPTAP